MSASGLYPDEFRRLQNHDVVEPLECDHRKSQKPQQRTKAAGGPILGRSALWRRSEWRRSAVSTEADVANAGDGRKADLSVDRGGFHKD